MSTTMRIFCATAVTKTPVAVRSFCSAVICASSKESDLHNENRAFDIEAAKQQLLQDRKDGKAEWGESLATYSESAIKADRGEHKTSRNTITELQHESVERSKQERK